MKTIRILEPGDRVTIEARGYSLCFSNDRGGTEKAPPGKYPVYVEKVWHDYETGYRATGRLENAADIEKFRKLGTTAYKPKKKGWRPEFVMFAGEMEGS